MAEPSGVEEVRARTILNRVREPGRWFGVEYGFNLYRGCHHGCIYCDSRSDCYHVGDFATVKVKVNAIELLRREASGRPQGTILGTGSMSDPYVPPEAHYGLTRRALAVLASRGLGVHLVTKSDLVVRDIDLLAQLSKSHASVALTVTTADDALAALVEPGAPSPSRRFAALAGLARSGIVAGVTLMPVLPFIEDSVANVQAIAAATAAAGGRFVIAGLGVTLRDRQRDYYYRCLDASFPGIKGRYEAAYGERYACDVPAKAGLRAALDQSCRQLGLITSMSGVVEAAAKQGWNTRPARLFS